MDIPDLDFDIRRADILKLMHIVDGYKDTFEEFLCVIT